MTARSRTASARKADILSPSAVRRTEISTQNMSGKSGQCVPNAPHRERIPTPLEFPRGQITGKKTTNEFASSLRAVRRNPLPLPLLGTYAVHSFQCSLPSGFGPTLHTKSDGKCAKDTRIHEKGTPVERCGKRANRQKLLILIGRVWRRGAGSNRRIKVLQTSPLPLGYRASGRLRHGMRIVADRDSSG